MADQNGNQQLNDNMAQNINHQPTGDPLVDAINTLVATLQNNQGLLNNHNAVSESQSKFSDSKWKFKEPHSTPKYKNSGDILKDFESGIKEQLLDSLAGDNFKKSMQSAMDTFAKEFGVDIRDVPHEIGKNLTKQAFDSFKKSDAGKAFEKAAKDIGNTALNSIFGKDSAAASGIRNTVSSFLSGSSGGTAGVQAAEQSMSALTSGGGLTTLAGGMGETTVAMTELTSAVGSAIPVIGLVVLALALLAPAFEGLADLAGALGKSFTKAEKLRQKRAEEAQTRLKADMEYMAKEPFEILKSAVESWTSTWDKNLREIGQTQGYDKEAVYALYEDYAERLRQDNLDSVISATDIIDKLSGVLSSGLSGEAAEQFAYTATKLSAAIPTQDFFSFADTYASIAANAIAQGNSQSQALAIANAQLEQFASNLLYSSRELAGGFSTGLKDASGLFSQAAQIAQSARTGNAADISGTLTSVSAIIGAVAPDLANSLVSNVVSAAIGGNNNSQLVALRSLAGINAGNTEFLQAMARDPQAVFAKLFSNLANMQNMSPDNYMEVAEGLADVFGIDMAAFARVDFNYLAQAVSAMNTNSDTLNDNLALLASGQTTTSAEQLKAQEINRVILDEGLAYVIDSEAGRAIQQHMWDEQIANQLAENTFAVDIQGSALKFLEGIREAITNLLNFLNPVGFIASGVGQMVANVVEQANNQADLIEILKLGAVGSNTNSLYNLTSVGKDLNLVTSLVEMMGGTKGTAVGNFLGGVSGVLSKASLAEVFNAAIDYDNKYYGSLIAGAIAGNDSVNKTSRYSWGSVGKSVYAAVQSSPLNTKLIDSVVKASNNSTQNAITQSNNRFQEFLDSAMEASKSMSYDAWVNTAKNFGISDFATALDNYGKTEEQIRGYFDANQARAGAIKEEDRKADEQLFRDENREFWDYSSGSNGIFQTAVWLPFFGEGQKYDTRMDAVDLALTTIQNRVGLTETHTVIGGIEEISRKLGDDSGFTVIGVLSQIQHDMSTTFVSTSSVFQRCLADWLRYISESTKYSASVSKSTAWSDLKAAEADQRTEATLALANALGVFSAEELKKMDPQLQSNVLLGEILVVLQTMLQQNNTQAGGLSLPDTLSALGLGMTIRQ